YRACLAPDEVELVATGDTISAILAMPAAKRTKAQAHKLRAYFMEKDAPQAIQQARRRLLDLQQRRARLIESFPTGLVMERRARPRAPFVLLRGQYNKPGARVTRGVPLSLSAFPKAAPPNRLGFARWLVDPSNPLTARVGVNRYWQM